MPRVIAQNEWLIAIDKPAGLIVHSDGRTEEPSLAEWIAEHFPALCGVGGFWVSPQGERIALNGLVHRLDRSTSGVVLAAKTSESFTYLKNEFKARRVQKTYVALLGGILAEESGTTVAEIMRSSEKPKRWYARPCEASDPRAAITDWRVLKRGSSMTLVEAYPKTGRTHQIRVHFSSIGHPLVGDYLYGGDVQTRTMPALHACKVSLVLPDGTVGEYVSPTPQYFFNI